MPRIRTIKPEFWTSEQVAEVSLPARLLFIGVWSFCDDNGVHPYRPRQLKMSIFPGDALDVSQLVEWLGELERANLITRFDAQGESFLWVTGFARHQRIDKPRFIYPAPPAASTSSRRVVEQSSNAPRQVVDKSSTIPRPVDEQSTTSSRPVDDESTSSRAVMEGNGREWKGKDTTTTTRKKAAGVGVDDRDLQKLQATDDGWSRIETVQLVRDVLEGAGYKRAGQLVTECVNLRRTPQDVAQVVGEYLANRSKFDSAGAIADRLRNGVWPVDGVKSVAETVRASKSKAAKQREQQVETLRMRLIRDVKLGEARDWTVEQVVAKAAELWGATS